MRWKGEGRKQVRGACIEMVQAEEVVRCAAEIRVGRNFDETSKFGF